MRFGEQLQMHVTPEWRKQYINYAKLKAILNQWTPEEVRGPGNEERHAAVGEEFFPLIRRELRKVDQFFLAREADALIKFDELSSDLSLTLASKNQPPLGPVASPAALSTGGRVRQRRRTMIGGAANPGLKAQDRSIASLRDAFSEFYLSLILLQNFEKVNTEGFRKICKKHDKILCVTSAMDFHRNSVLQAYSHKSTSVCDLILKTENAVIERLEGGNRQKAMNKLRVPPLDSQVEPSTLFRLGLWLGVFVTCLLALIIGAVYVDVSKADRALEVLRLFRFGFIILLMAFLIGINFYFFRRAGVNHVLIFEVNPRDNLPGVKIMEISSMLATLWMLCVLLYFYLDLTAVPVKNRLGIPIAVVAMLFVYLLNPFKFWHYSARRWLIRRLARIFSAPYFDVEFADFWLADQLNSIVVSFGDFEFLVCFYIFDWNRDPFIEQNNKCGVVTYGLRPIVLALPAWFRFAQCLRRYFTTREGNPHLINAGKYSTTFVVVLFSSLVSWEKGNYGGVQQYSYLFVLWVLSALVSTCYTSYWDLWRDWGLMDRTSPPGQRFLRHELVYSNTWLYYLAMVGDVSMRLLWTLSVSVAEGGLIHSEILRTILSVVEVFRRFVWNFFRLENEHLNNVGQFRAVRDISIVPINSSHRNPDGGGDNEDGAMEIRVLPPGRGALRSNGAEDDDEENDDFEMRNSGGIGPASEHNGSVHSFHGSTHSAMQHSRPQAHRRWSEATQPTVSEGDVATGEDASGTERLINGSMRRRMEFHTSL